MPRYLIHKDGAYNEFTTVADGACWEKALTLAQLEESIEFQFGQSGLDVLPERLARAHATGCSGHDWTLDECIASNRCGPGESNMPRDEFIRRYLTLEPEPSTLETPAGTVLLKTPRRLPT